MKMIVAVFRPERLQAVKDSLKEAGIKAMTITDVRGRGQQSGLVFSNRVGTITIDEIEKVKVEVVVEDQEEKKAIDAIRGAARTGHEGDGRIFVIPVESSIRIRDGRGLRKVAGGGPPPSKFRRAWSSRSCSRSPRCRPRG